MQRTILSVETLCPNCEHIWNHFLVMYWCWYLRFRLWNTISRIFLLISLFTKLSFHIMVKIRWPHSLPVEDFVIPVYISNYNEMVELFLSTLFLFFSERIFSSCKKSSPDFDGCIKRAFNKLRSYFKVGEYVV